MVLRRTSLPNRFFIDFVQLVHCIIDLEANHQARIRRIRTSLFSDSIVFLTVRDNLLSLSVCIYIGVNFLPDHLHRSDDLARMSFHITCCWLSDQCKWSGRKFTPYIYNTFYKEANILQVVNSEITTSHHPALNPTMGLSVDHQHKYSNLPKGYINNVLPEGYN